MKNLWSKILLTLIIGVLIVGGFHASSQSRQPTSKVPAPPGLQERLTKNSGRPQKAEFGAAPVESQEDRQRRQIREGLGKGLFRRPIVDPGTKEVEGQAETLELTFIDSVKILKPGERPDPPGLPVSSTAIVTGTVVSGKAFIAEDHTFVYSDYQIQINEVLKSDPDRVITVGDQITAWRFGGSLNFPSGHIRHFIISGRGFPEVGTQYVFFLRRTDSRLNAYGISTAYALKDGLVLPLDDEQGNNRFDGTEATNFLTKLRSEM